MVSTVTPASWASSSMRQRGSGTSRHSGLTVATLRAYTRSVLPPGVHASRAGAQEQALIGGQRSSPKDPRGAQHAGHRNPNRSEAAGAFVAGVAVALGRDPRGPARPPPRAAGASRLALDRPPVDCGPPLRSTCHSAPTPTAVGAVARPGPVRPPEDYTGTAVSPKHQRAGERTEARSRGE